MQQIYYQIRGIAINTGGQEVDRSILFIDK